MKPKKTQSSRLSSTTYIQRKPHVMAKKIGNDYFIIDIDRNRFYTLNGSAEVIWKYLWKPRTLQELVSKMIAAFDVTPSQAEKDAREFIERYSTLFRFC